MSPLAPHISNRLDLLNKGKDATPNLMEPMLNGNGNGRHVYSIQDLMQMRHDRSDLPHSSNHNVLALISRTQPAATTSKFSSMISFNLVSPGYNQFIGDRRQSYRPMLRQGNGGNVSNGNGFMGDRQRQFNRDKGQSSTPPNGLPTIRLSIKSDVKLKEAENAWKPSFLQKSDKNANDDAEELYKQVRSILNKLTAQNFGVLSEQFKNLKIDTKEKLTGVINVVFNKAVNEPNFSEAYAKLCQYLSQCWEQIDSSGEERLYFKRTLINRCQLDFEKYVANRNSTEAALAPLLEKMKICKEGNDTRGVNEIKAQITEEESILRRRLVSTVRFIGELYKLDMLTTNIMNLCISVLIREAAPNQANMTQANEKLECLCKLLTTVGGKLESKVNGKSTPNLDLAGYIHQLKRISENKIRHFQCSTRIKFMIMDVIELRQNRWNKITIAQINN